MPHSKSRKKQINQDLVACEANKALSSSMKTSIKKLMAAVESKDSKGAQGLLQASFKRIDKAAKRRVIHPNKASRSKSRLARIVNQIQEA